MDPIQHKRNSNASALPGGGCWTRMYVLSSGLSGNSLESCVLGLLSAVLSSRAAIVIAEFSWSSGIDTRQSVSCFEAMASNLGDFLALIWFLRSSTVSSVEILTEKALDVDSPSMRQNRFRPTMVGKQ